MGRMPVFVLQVQKHCQTSQSKVKYKFSDLSDTNVFIAEFRESIRPAIVSLLGDGESDVRRAGADALSKLSEQGKVYIF